jgi:hypothetical protein
VNRRVAHRRGGEHRDTAAVVDALLAGRARTRIGAECWRIHVTELDEFSAVSAPTHERVNGGQVRSGETSGCVPVAASDMRNSSCLARRIHRSQTREPTSRELTEVVVRLRSVLMTMIAVLGMVVVGGTSGALGAAAEVPARMFAPVYDAVTAASMHELALALTSYGLDAGGYDGLTVSALADWGWTPGDRTAVTIWVAGDDVRAVSQDVRPGSAQYEYTFARDVGTSGTVGRSAVQPAEAPREAVVTIVPVTRL